VLRLRDGDVVSVTDGQGRWCLAVVVVDGNALRLEASTPVVVEPPPTRTITIAAAMPKGDRLDWMVQKVTELGVDRLVLLHAEHSVVRWKPDRVEHQLARLQRIADEALRQSRRVQRMTIDAPVPATDVLGQFVAAEPGGRTLRAGDTAVAVGPEGGWSPSELAVCRDRIDLGPTILRTETAAVAVSALCVAFER
jgi:16S rRNA (uracil1498-N3)-methyltransferase